MHSIIAAVDWFSRYWWELETMNEGEVSLLGLYHYPARGMARDCRFDAACRTRFDHSGVSMTPRYRAEVVVAEVDGQKPMASALLSNLVV